MHGLEPALFVEPHGLARHVRHLHHVPAAAQGHVGLDPVHAMGFIPTGGFHGILVPGADQFPHDALVLDGDQRHAARRPDRPDQRDHHLVGHVESFDEHPVPRLDLRRMSGEYLCQVVVSWIVHGF